MSQSVIIRLKKQTNRTYKPKIVSLKLGNQPELYFDPNSLEIEWTVRRESNVILKPSQSSQQSNTMQGKLEKVKEMQKYEESIEKEVLELQSKLSQIVKANEKSQKQYQQIRKIVQNRKKQFQGLRLTSQELQNLWKDYCDINT